MEINTDHCEERPQGGTWQSKCRFLPHYFVTFCLDTKSNQKSQDLDIFAKKHDFSFLKIYKLTRIVVEVNYMRFVSRVEQCKFYRGL